MSTRTERDDWTKTSPSGLTREDDKLRLGTSANSASIAVDEKPQHVTSFRFAFGVGMIILIGFVMAGSGIVLTKAGLFVVGTIIATIGLWLYGRSLAEEHAH